MLGVAITTASQRPESSKSRSSPNRAASGASAAASSSEGGWGSASAVTRAPGRCEMLAMCSRPIIPVPTTP